MAPSEMSELRELKELLIEHRGDFRVFKTKMLGDDEAELSTGRIPTIEATQSDHESRITRLEASRTKLLGALAAITGMGWLIEILFHAQGALKR